MKLEEPKQFFIIAGGEKTDLLDTLQEKPVMDHKGWTATHKA